MESPPLPALVSSIVSQSILLLLLLLFPSNPIPPLLLSSSHIAAAAATLLPSRRKRRRHTEEPSPDEQDSSPSISSIPPHPNPDHFSIHFGMKSSTFEWLVGLLDPLIDSRDPPGSPLRLPTTTRLALALSRLFGGAHYADLAARFAVSQPAARFCARHLCRVLCTNYRFWLTFPSTPELLLPVAAGFSDLAGLPGCCGAVASVRFHLRPGAAAAFLVADASSKILSFTAVFPGDRSELEVLKLSSLFREAKEGRLLGQDQYLVGDERHRLSPWLMVPFADPVAGSGEEDFNVVLCRIRRPARRAISSLLNWRVLNDLREENTKAAMGFIATCAILHNVLLMREDDSALADIAEESLMSHADHRHGEEEHSAEKKAILLRNTLALRARGLRGSYN
ncbi:hypothetical protein AXF42_Ash012437 [Apostasia shenzhenica]|uniref:DDE Tnp4 domain-containing protein n=1 Tax=Apostasia shenzhenica TaxID=1088818 RepID=A0A2I0AQU1_9ASPA|nr:hypothetical protein AXF42_Ash012437 [Apostasia shenzhenica]